ncbi:MBL fold metallo-hydrolase [Nannocystis radixulma]|uniref:MBL fold metallo-hydrolase n=1 Tax=Nannocystis radixulma TaxID=2995305 RepID=A0ABT5BEM0_9BACT|nr:MBL fold metallo-hydrolase [Nannocystis radixulma]MDC0672153.1 MBL fold metallo-hydrolase [Nannocystis radixulma]
MERLAFADDVRVQALVPGFDPHRAQRFILAIHQALSQRIGLDRAILDAAARYPEEIHQFTFDPACPAETFGPRPDLLFPEHRAAANILCNRRGELAGWSVTEKDAFATIRALLRGAALGDGSLEQDGPWQPLARQLLQRGFVRPTKRRPHQGFEPGIHRLQHASLLVRTERSSVILDPHIHSTYSKLAVEDDFSAAALLDASDGVLISHSHEDHWYLASLMMMSSTTQFVVPHVPRTTLLSPDMGRWLADLGFEHVRTPAWYSEPLAIGDILVHTLPFYGEQPLVSEAWRPDLRSWGNTYLIETPDFRMWVLIDSGNEPTHSMAEVAEYVRRRFGPVDLVASNLRHFATFSPFYIAGGHYWAALTAEQIATFPTRNEVVTLGPHGVAEICQIVGARHYIPYAHWWGRIGHPPEQEERELLADLQIELDRFGSACKIHDWPIGGHFSPTLGKQLRT